MSIKSKILAAAATLTLVGSLGLAGAVTAGTAGAATPSCGNSCVNPFARDFGTHQTPAYALDVLKQGERVGQPIILFRTANFDPAEDWTVAFQGAVADFDVAGLVSPAIVLHYGCGFNLQTGKCSTTVNPVTGLPFPDDWAFEIEYAPFGVQSGLCMGLAAAASDGEGVTLQGCGQTSRTVWVIDQADSSTGQLNPLLDEYVPLINGSDATFSHPFVLTYPSPGFPTDKPRPQLVVKSETGFSNPGTGDPAGVDSSQLWGADIGILK
jgi:hypothetical protein